jgi:hypothetical protein
MAAGDPGQAYYYALTHPEQFGWKAPQVQAELFQQWMFQDPAAAMDYRVQIALEQRLAAQQQEIAPVQQHYMAQMQDSAIQWAQKELPDFDAYAQDVQALLQKYPDRYQQVMGERPSPQSMQEVIKEAYARARYERYDTERRLPKPPAAVAEPPAATRSQTRSNANPPSASSDDDIRNMILNAGR